VVGQHVRGGGRPSAGAGIIRDVVHGRWGVDIIAVTAIVSAVAVGEYVAALIVVLMLYGGSALEDYASGRAKAEPLNSWPGPGPPFSTRPTPFLSEVDVPSLLASAELPSSHVLASSVVTAARTRATAEHIARLSRITEVWAGAGRRGADPGGGRGAATNLLAWQPFSMRCDH